jgi:hypothetical protein
MIKKLLVVAVALAVVSQGIAHADEPVPPGVTVVQDRAALALHIDGLEEGDRVAVATEEGVVAGEVVDKDRDDLVIDQPLIQGGAERIVIPLKEIQGVRYQVSQQSKSTVAGKVLVVAIVVLTAIWLVPRLFLPGP